MPNEHHLRIAAAILALAGLGVASYVAIAESGGGTPVCVAGGGGCETVAQSSYAELAGINVAAIGVFGYATLLAAAAIPGDAGRFAGLLLSLVGVGFSAYLTYLEFGVIEAFCHWCLASATIMALLLAVNAARAFGYAGATSLQGP